MHYGPNLKVLTEAVKAIYIYAKVQSCHGPINHGLATPFLSYMVALHARKMWDFIRDLNIWQSYKLGPLRQYSDS